MNHRSFPSFIPAASLLETAFSAPFERLYDLALSLQRLFLLVIFVVTAVVLAVIAAVFAIISAVLGLCSRRFLAVLTTDHLSCARCY